MKYSRYLVSSGCCRITTLFCVHLSSWVFYITLLWYKNLFVVFISGDVVVFNVSFVLNGFVVL